MTPLEKAKRALDSEYNEFIADYLEPLEKCQASRDEAHEEAARIVEIGQACAELAIRFKCEDKQDQAFAAGAYILDVSLGQALLAAAIEVALVEKGE